MDALPCLGEERGVPAPRLVEVEEGGPRGEGVGRRGAELQLQRLEIGGGGRREQGVGVRSLAKAEFEHLSAQTQHRRALAGRRLGEPERRGALLLAGDLAHPLGVVEDAGGPVETAGEDSGGVLVRNELEVVCTTSSSRLAKKIVEPGSPCRPARPRSWSSSRPLS